jgi:serine/threonine protein kinase
MHKYKLQGKKGEGTFSEVRRRVRLLERHSGTAPSSPADAGGSRALRAWRAAGALRAAAAGPRARPSRATRRARLPTPPLARGARALDAQVLKGTSLKSGKPVAIKCMKHVFDNVEQVNALREIQALKRLSPHPNIVKLHEVL